MEKSSEALPKGNGNGSVPHDQLPQPVVTKEAPQSFFDKSRGEREMYQNAKHDEPVLLPLTREGFDELVNICINKFTPPLPHDDSVRKVFAGWVHRISNEVNTTTIDDISKILYKSIANALTWTIDQEIKAKQQAAFAAHQAKAKAASDEAAKELAAEKRQRKASRRVTVTKPDEKVS